MDAINQDILKQLQEHAQKYFAAIIEANSTNGECDLKEGRYSAKDMIDHSRKSVFGRAYYLPEDATYDETITLESGTFKCRFPYRRIFAVLADWETMCKAGKQKAVFEIGEVEEKSAKVLVNDKTILGAFKTKTMKLQRIGGNWWGQSKEIQKEGFITGYYELNGVIFAPGKTFQGKVRDESNKKFTEKFNDAEITKMLISFLAKYTDGENVPYFAEVAHLAGIDTETEEAKAIADTAKEEQRKREEEAREFATETAQISTETAETVNVSAEGEKKAEMAFVSMCIKHREEYAPRYSHYSLYRFNDTMFAFGKEAEMAREYFQDNKYCPLSEVEREHDGEKYLCFHISHYNGNVKGRIRGLMEQKHIAEYRTPSNGLIAVWDSEEVKFWSRHAVPTEPPQSPETPQAVNMSAEEKIGLVRHISEIIETCRTWDAETCDYTDEYKYYTWLANHIPEHKATNKNTAELILEEVQERISAAATLTAHRVPKYDIERAVCAVVNRLAKMEDILQFYNRTEPPQSPETPEITNYTAGPEKRATKPQNEPKQVIRIFLTTDPRTCKKFLIVANVPRIVPRRRYQLFHGRCSTECHFVDIRKMVCIPQGCSPPDRHPPIRGDCVPVLFTRQTTRINKLQRINLRL